MTPRIDIELNHGTPKHSQPYWAVFTSAPRTAAQPFTCVLSCAVGLPCIHISATDSSITSTSRLPCLVLWPRPLFHLKSETLTTRTSDRFRHRLVKNIHNNNKTPASDCFPLGTPLQPEQLPRRPDLAVTCRSSWT